VGENRMTILIPAYMPDGKMIKLIEDLKATGKRRIIIVDDGSGEGCRHLFDTAKEKGCIVLTHDKNMGKGKALKTGFKYIIRENLQESVVTADCDGQHIPEDIIKVGEACNAHKDCIIMGRRKFAKDVPLRSRIGNGITRMVFDTASGSKLYDTQTGLRGFSFDMLPWLCSLKGDRYEYEMNMLLQAASEGYGFFEIPINTVYLEKNKSSHFNTFKDSVKVYLPIIKYSMSSITAGLIDFFLLMVFQLFTPSLFLAVMGARVCSSLYNYTMNRLFVFPGGRNISKGRSMSRYFLLVVVVMLLNYGVLLVYNKVIGIPLFFAKIFTEVTIFVFSFWCQKVFVFKQNLPN
jgi:glycosyltransferase involved in cell wall biosynthesis